MPLIRIDIIKGKNREYKKTLSDSVHEALIEAFGIENWDRFLRIVDCNGNHKTDKLKSKRFMKNLSSAEVLLDYRKNMRYNLSVRCFVVA